MTLTARVIRNARKQGIIVYDRRQWGSNQLATYQWRRVNRRHLQLPRKPTDTLVQHITVTRDDGPLPGNFFEDMQEVERIGMERFGTGFPYNWGIDFRTGEVGLGQSLDAAGAHTINEKNVPGFSENMNYTAIAFAMIGMPGQRLSAKAAHSMSVLMAAHIEEGALTLRHDYVPHSMFAAKSCPTENVRRRMATIQGNGRKIALTNMHR